MKNKIRIILVGNDLDSLQVLEKSEFFRNNKHVIKLIDGITNIDVLSNIKRDFSSRTIVMALFKGEKDPSLEDVQRENSKNGIIRTINKFDGFPLVFLGDSYLYYALTRGRSMIRDVKNMKNQDINVSDVYGREFSVVMNTEFLDDIFTKFEGISKDVLLYSTFINSPLNSLMSKIPYDKHDSIEYIEPIITTCDRDRDLICNIHLDLQSNNSSEMLIEIIFDYLFKKLKTVNESNNG